ncbi:hypothetical protein SBP18_14425 [Rhodoferax ferrireducens]|uniref:hypothetical protein n=1 Tax=Rhodoferax ferrireducens TaxID=192843 RepID=UPI00298E5721|nr:hypothetical protein [Rhodoferax ferrireducens]WPC65679.1 hypothetical protein SBP18_14425 [Rhodoferax ferrireducens]
MLTISTLDESLEYLVEQTGRAWTASQFFDFVTRHKMNLHAVAPNAAMTTAEKNWQYGEEGEGWSERRHAPGSFILARVRAGILKQLWMNGETETDELTRNDGRIFEGIWYTEPIQVTRDTVRVTALTLQEIVRIWRSEQAATEPQQVPAILLAAPVVAESACDGVEPAKAGPGWSLKTSLERAPGYRWPLYQVLKAAHIAGQPCPHARNVLDTWAINPPLDLQVMPDGVKYNDALGNPKEANLKAIQQAIKGLMK